MIPDVNASVARGLSAEGRFDGEAVERFCGTFLRNFFTRRGCLEPNARHSRPLNKLFWITFRSVRSRAPMTWPVALSSSSRNIICTRPRWSASICATSPPTKAGGWPWPTLAWGFFPYQGKGSVHRLDVRAVPAAPSPPRQQCAPAGAGGLTLSKPGQQVDETPAGAPGAGLAGALGPSAGAGGKLRGSAILPRRGLPGQRLVAAGRHGGLAARGRRFSPPARHAQANLGARTGPQSVCETARVRTARAVEVCRVGLAAALPVQGRGALPPDGFAPAGVGGVPPSTGAGVSAGGDDAR